MRRPAPLIAAPYARLAAYVLLAAVGALQWARYVEGASTLRALLWVGAGAATGAGVIAASRLPRRWRLPAAVAAVLGGGLLAVAVSGLDVSYLRPRHWDELADGIGRGAQALNTVRLPYLGKDPWVLATVELAGALLCWGAAVASTWRPARAGARLPALVLLLVLAASPIVSLGSARPVVLGLALAALTTAFLFLERLSRRPGLGLAILAVVCMVVAVPLGHVADREQPWFDYKSFSENFSGGRPLTFDWGHGYGPIDWPREGAEVMRVRSAVPFYWKADQLTDFDGREWITGTRSDPGGDKPVDDLPADWRDHPGWNATFTVALRRLKSETVVGAGTALRVTDATQPVLQDAVPGRWVAAGARDLGEGDSYTVHAHVPRPTPQQLAAATVGRDARRHGMLTMRMAYRPDARDLAPLRPYYPGRAPEHLDDATIRFRPFEDPGRPVAAFRTLGTEGDGDAALRASYYERTWALAKRLKRRSTSAYDYLLRVNAYLRAPRFRYSEVPPRVQGDVPLESFLFDTRLGYCQQYSGAMVLLLRMGGIPARVATGFSPGGYRRTTGEWVVRDTDAHSWVEAWFDGLGWVTFDPTRAQTPARSQIAVIEPAPRRPISPAAIDRSSERAPNRRPEGLGPGSADARTTSSDGGTPWLIYAAFALGALGLAGGALSLRRRRDGPGTGPDVAVRELERALRRSGRPIPTGTTLTQLEQRLGASADAAGYLRSLSAARYGTQGGEPTNVQRAALRRELAAGLGWQGRARALWALPPRLYPLRRPPR